MRLKPGRASQPSGSIPRCGARTSSWEALARLALSEEAFAAHVNPRRRAAIDIVSTEGLGRFSLRPSQKLPRNVYVSLAILQGELNHPNNGTYTITFNADVKPGSNYKIKITDAKHANDFIFTTAFKVKRKVPMKPLKNFFKVMEQNDYKYLIITGIGTDDIFRQYLREFIESLTKVAGVKLPFYFLFIFGKNLEK